MISEDGNNYQEYESNEWPNDKYKFKKAKCIDNKGNLINDVVAFENGKATIKTDKTIYCTLYFDHKETIEILREKDTNKNISPEPNQGGMYRYQGTDNVTNWICFGTSDLSECLDEKDADKDGIPDGIDKYMYRIIGITPSGELYLLKETFLKEENNYGFAWNNKYSIDSSNLNYCENKICPEWNTSLLFKRINGISNGSVKGTGYNDGANTDIFVDSEYYDYLKLGDKNNDSEKASKWYNLIADHNWMYGDIGDETVLSTYKGQPAYEIETGNADVKHYVITDENVSLQKYRWTKKVTAKISLMYVHDYYYAYYNGSTEESRGNPSNGTNVKNSWIHFLKDGYVEKDYPEWTSTRWNLYDTSNPITGAIVMFAPTSIWSHWNLYESLRLRPVFYLESKAKITDGDGTKENPFRIEI